MKYYKVILKTGSTVVMSTSDDFNIESACKIIQAIRYEEISQTEFNVFAESNKCYNENLREIVKSWDNIQVPKMIDMNAEREAERRNEREYQNLQNMYRNKFYGKFKKQLLSECMQG